MSPIHDLSIDTRRNKYSKGEVIENTEDGIIGTGSREFIVATRLLSSEYVFRVVSYEV